MRSEISEPHVSSEFYTGTWSIRNSGFRAKQMSKNSEVHTDFLESEIQVLKCLNTSDLVNSAWNLRAEVLVSEISGSEFHKRHSIKTQFKHVRVCVIHCMLTTLCGKIKNSVWWACVESNKLCICPSLEIIWPNWFPIIILERVCLWVKRRVEHIMLA